MHQRNFKIFPISDTHRAPIHYIIRQDSNDIFVYRSDLIFKTTQTEFIYVSSDAKKHSAPKKKMLSVTKSTLAVDPFCFYVYASMECWINVFVFIWSTRLRYDQNTSGVL